MNIVICMKETPSTTAEKRFGPDMRLERRKEDAIINPFDEYTIEEGLRQQEKHGGETVVLTMGPAAATDTIRKALAMGARSRRARLRRRAGRLGCRRHGARARRRAAEDRLRSAALRQRRRRRLRRCRAEHGGRDSRAAAALLRLQARRGRRQGGHPAPGRGRLQHRRGGNAGARQRRQVDQRAALPLDEGHHVVEEEAHRHDDLADLGLDTSKAGAGASGERAVSSEKVATARKGEIYMGNEGAAERIVAFLAENKVL